MSKLKNFCGAECTYRCLKPRSEPYTTKNMLEKTPNILISEINLKINGLSKNFYCIVEDQLQQSFITGIISDENCGVIRANGDSEANEKNSKSNEFVLSGCKDMIRFLFCKFHSYFSQNSLKSSRFLELRSKSQIIGLIDRDFEKDNNDGEIIKIQCDPNHFFNLFRTETNDIETFILKYNGLNAFIKLNFTNESSQQILDKILDQASMIGLARYLNENNIPKSERKLNFQHLKQGNPYCKFISDKQFMTEKQAILLIYENVENRTKSPQFNSLYTARISNRKKLFKDLWEICQGHDTIKILLCFQRCCSKGKLDLREREISEMILEFAFQDSSYTTSQFIKELIQWEKQVHPSHFEISEKGKLFEKSLK